tara:strand:- start:4474 stop:5139 length:666 start_codon:yes stop_codon:yes gene_type:complete
MNNYAALIPLRGGSKGIKRKNLILINGKPLFYYVAKSSLEAGVKTFISTEDSEIKKVCKNYFSEIEIIDRPISLASDNSSTEDVIQHFLSIEKGANDIILLQATSPLTNKEDIQNSIKLYEKNNKKTLLSVVQNHSFTWSHKGNPLNYDPQDRPRRQDWDGYYIENGAIYIFSRKDFSNLNSRCSKNSTLFKMKKESLFEIDSLEDVIVISSIMKSKEPSI